MSLLFTTIKSNDLIKVNGFDARLICRNGSLSSIYCINIILLRLCLSLMRLMTQSEETASVGNWLNFSRLCLCLSLLFLSLCCFLYFSLCFVLLVWLSSLIVWWISGSIGRVDLVGICCCFTNKHLVGIRYILSRMDSANTGSLSVPLSRRFWRLSATLDWIQSSGLSLWYATLISIPARITPETR